MKEANPLNPEEALKTGRGKTTIKKAAALALITAGVGVAAGVGIEALNNNSTPVQEQVKKVASQYSAELYDTQNFPTGVEVPGVLNGTIIVRTADGMQILHRHPVILEQSTMDKKLDATGQFLNGTWIGIPSSDAKGHVVITPLHVELGTHKGIEESVSINSAVSEVVYPAAGLYATNTTSGRDELMAFDIQGNGNFPSVPIESQVQK